MLQVPVRARSSKRKIHAPRGKRNVNTNKKINNNDKRYEGVEQISCFVSSSQESRYIYFNKVGMGKGIYMNSVLSILMMQWRIQFKVS
jgi:hypothetical protein